MNDIRVPWTVRDVVVGLILFLVILTGGSLIINRILAEVLPAGSTVATLFIGYLIALALVWYLAIRERGGNWPDLGFRSFDVGRGIGLVIGWFIIVRFASFIYGVIIQRLGFEMPEDTVRRLPELFGRSLTGFLLAVLVVAIVAPIVEEVLFRGFLYPAFRQRWGVTTAIIASGLIFALFHPQLLLLIPIAIIGFVLAYLFEVTGSIGPPILLHALNNFVSVIAIFFGQNLLQ